MNPFLKDGGIDAEDRKLQFLDERLEEAARSLTASLKPRMAGEHAVRQDGIYMEDVVMELRLNRRLADDEVPWHRNGNTLDNRDENLVLMKFGVDWCLEADVER